MNGLDSQIAFIALNPRLPLLRSMRLGFENVGVHPSHLILVSPRDRLLAEWRRHRLSVVGRTLAPKARQMLGAKHAASAEDPEPELPPLTVDRVKRLNSDETVACIRRLGIRYLINAGAGIVRAPLVNVPDLVIVNAHAGALPAYRNMNVVEWALYNNEPVIGTVHRIDAGIDTGPTMLAAELDLSGATSVAEARERAFDQVGRLVGKAVVAHAANQLPTVEQLPGGRRWYVMHPAFTRALDARLGSSADDRALP